MLVCDIYRQYLSVSYMEGPLPVSAAFELSVVTTS